MSQTQRNDTLSATKAEQIPQLSPKIDYLIKVQSFIELNNDIHSSDSFSEVLKELIDDPSTAPILSDDFYSIEMHMGAIYSEFDESYYLENNPDVSSSGINPLYHYCTYGWKELRRPNPRFDTWWYWREHLNINYDKIDPLLHYLLVGKKLDYHTEFGTPIKLRTNPVRYAADQNVRRICLFAAFDQHGIVDDYVVDYLKELSKFADVYYLADCEMQPGQLEKLDTFVKNRWSVRHGAYDFGSYSLLAKELVGWEKINEYDELILANDSCYLLRPLGDVFAKMDAIPTDWWGMQATKGIWATRDIERMRITNPIPMEFVKDHLLASFEGDPNYTFLVGSYFSVYRKSVINDLQFREFIEHITPQGSKSQIIKKYEIGLTRQLIHGGYQFHTFIDDLHPLHPIYDTPFFTLLEQGFPFLKRYLLTENHYGLPGLLTWKDQIKAVVPNCKLDAIEQNLFRVADNEKLFRNFHVQRDAHNKIKYPDLYTDNELISIDKAIPKHDLWWAFPVCAFDHTFSGNERAVFERVRLDGRIKKIVLTRSKHVKVEGNNIEIVPLKSRAGQDFLLRSRVIFIKHTVSSNIGYPLCPKQHHFVNLWHGIPLKRIGHTSLDMREKLRAIEREHRKLKVVISSSKVDSLAMATAFYPLTYHDIWLTGLPRNDFILQPFDELPSDLREEEMKLRAALDGRRLILFFPTFRNGANGAGYQFTAAELQQLEEWLSRNNAALAVREHMADREKTYRKQLSGAHFIDASSYNYPNIEVLFRVSDALITDYSSCFIDYMLTGKHLISFAYDLESYQNSERGTFYDLEFCFAGDVCKRFEEVLLSLDEASRNNFDNNDAAFEWKRKLFFEFVDAGSADRVVKKVEELIGGM